MSTGTTRGMDSTRGMGSSSRDWMRFFSCLWWLAFALAIVFGLAIYIAVPAWAQSAVLLPNGKQQFLDANGSPLAGGQVFMYVAPATTTPKTTWQDAARVTPNANPVVLDSSGEALIYGVGTYRQLVKDAIGNTIWDAQTNGLGGNTYAGVSTGSANAQVGAASDFANVNGSQTSFTAGFTNSSTMTYNAGFGAWPVVEDTLAGPVALAGGEITASNFVLLSWDSVNSRFHIVNNTFNPVTLAKTTQLNEPSNLTLSVTAAGGILTVAIKTAAGADPSVGSPVVIPFHDSSAYGAGGISYVSLTAAKSQTLSLGSTLGVPQINSAFRVWIVAFNNAGSVQIGLILCTTFDATLSASGVFNLIQYPLERNAQVAVTLAEGGAGGADFAQTFFTATGLVNKFYTVIGSATWESGLGVLGTWTAPTRVQLFNANATLPGDIIQTGHFWQGGEIDTAAVIPYDNTIPQESEGGGIFSQGIATSSNANLVHATAHLMLSCDTANITGTVSLFNTGSGNAKAAESVTFSAIGLTYPIGLEYIALGSTTFNAWTVNAGPSAAATITVNGVAAARKLGGVAASYLILQEIQS